MWFCLLVLVRMVCYRLVGGKVTMMVSLRKLLVAGLSAGLYLGVGLPVAGPAVAGTDGAGSCSYTASYNSNSHTARISSISCTGGMIAWAWVKYTTTGTTIYTNIGSKVSTGSSSASFTSGYYYQSGGSWG